MFEPGAHLFYDKYDSYDLINGLILMEFEIDWLKAPRKGVVSNGQIYWLQS